MPGKLPKLLLSVLLLVSGNAVAANVGGVEFADKITVDGKELALNGAGVRKKFFVSVYAAALYVPAPSSDPQQLLSARGPKRLQMTFIYDKVEKKKLDSAWQEGFRDNLSAAEQKQLDREIATFVALFGDAKKGDTIHLDQTTSGATSISINNQIKGNIESPAFYPALLSIWIGKHPITGALRRALLAEK